MNALNVSKKLSISQAWNLISVVRILNRIEMSGIFNTMEGVEHDITYENIDCVIDKKDCS